MKKNNLITNLYRISIILNILGALLFLFIPQIASYIFTIGAITFILLQVIHAINDKSDKWKKRRSRIAVFSSLFLLIAAYFMFTGSNSWVVAILIFALSNLYLSFRK